VLGIAFATDGSPTSEVAGHSSLPLQAQFLSSGQLIAMAAFDGHLRIFSLSLKMAQQAKLKSRHEASDHGISQLQLLSEWFVLDENTAAQPSAVAMRIQALQDWCDTGTAYTEKPWSGLIDLTLKPTDPKAAFSGSYVHNVRATKRRGGYNVVFNHVRRCAFAVVKEASVRYEDEQANRHTTRAMALNPNDACVLIQIAIARLLAETRTDRRRSPIQ
jgi:hypothetical protein